MSKNITKLSLIILLIGLQIRANAQQWLGRTTGNYSGTYGVYNNASSIADSKYKYYFNFWGRGINFYNNYLSYNAPVKLNHWANNTLDVNAYKNLDGKMQIGDDWFNENLNGKDKQFSFTQDIWGPAFMFPVSKNWNMSINTRQRSGLQILGISEDAARMARNGISNNQNASISKRFSANMQTFQELSFTLGGILTRNENHLLSGGATVKLIRGLGAAYLKGNEINIQGSGSNSALVNGDFQYAYTDDKAAIAPFNDPYGLFSLESRGAGAGFDLGMTYTYRSDRLRYKSKLACDRNDLKSDYDIKLSMAFNDIGGVRYNRRSNVYAYSSQAYTSVNASPDILNGFGIPSQNGFDSIGKNVFAQMGATASSGFNTALPAAFTFQADFRFSKNFFTAVYLNQSLKSVKTTGIRSTSMLSVIPRIESRGFEFSMPITLSENYKNLYLGAYARIGPVFFGSDNLGGLLNVASGSEFRGADIYGGISFGIGHCHSWWYNDNVDPVYMDSLKNDTLKQQFRDTVKSIEKDTILIRDTVKVIKKDTVYIDKKNKEVLKKDTVYIERVIKSTASIEREKELKRRETELNNRRLELEAREKELAEKQKGTYNETEAVKNCNNENAGLKNKVNAQVLEIDQLKKQNQTYELEKQKCNEEKIRTNAEIIRLQEDVLKSNRKIAELENEVAVLKKAAALKPSYEVGKGSEAEKLARANKQLDSMKLVVLYLQSDIEKCKKNAVANNAEILKKAEQDKAKAQNDARVAKKTSDSLGYVLTQRTTELENCKKNAGLNNSEIVKQAELDRAKAQNDARIARKQADSLNYILTQRTLELENCKKNSTQNEAEVQKMKKCEDENAILKAEMQEMSKTIGRLNTKNYALSNRIDSLVNELKNCCKNCGTGSSNDAELLKQCQAGKAELEAEIVRLKSTVARQNKSLDSMETALDAQAKKQVELNAQISKLNTEITDLKAKGSSNNCDEIQKQLDEKSAELNKVKNEATVLQSKVKTLEAQLAEYKTEYNFMVKQSQKCSMKLDSCMRGLYNLKPEDHKEDSSGSGGSGPHEGQNSNDSGNEARNNSSGDDVYTTTEKTNRGIRAGAKILGAILDVAVESSKSGSSQGGGSSSSGSGSKKPTETNNGSSGSAGSNGSGTSKKPSENSSGTSGSGNTGGSRSGGNNSGSNGAGSGNTNGSGGSRDGGAVDGSTSRR